MFTYFGVISLIGGERATKDFIYFTTWSITSSYLIILLFVSAKNIDKFLIWVTLTIIAHAVMASLVAVAVRFGFQADFGEYQLIQAPWVSDRLHGYLGEPTAFGSLLGLSLVCVAFLQKKSHLSIQILLFVALSVSLVWSDSRNGLVSALLAVVILLGLSKRYLKMAACVAILIATYFVLSPSNLVDDGNSGLLESAQGRLVRSSESVDHTDERTYIWKEVWDRTSNGNTFEILFGHGSQAISNEYRSAFNTVLETQYDYGILGVFIVASLIFVTSIQLIKSLRSRRQPAAFGLAMLTFFLVFSQFWTTLPRWFFNYPAFALVLAATLCALIQQESVPSSQGTQSSKDVNRFRSD
tara:strand:- start:7969 stop:9033 length:1065 start_codon:yes stop_codon:yes gene_type:complete